jgi:hypothetical protein
MTVKLFLSLVLMTSAAGCGTVATELGERTNSIINRQEQTVDNERGKIVYTSESCEGNTSNADSSRCAVVMRDKQPKKIETPQD